MSSTAFSLSGRVRVLLGSLMAFAPGMTRGEDASKSEPRAVPLTRPEMKQMLEDMKQRTQRGAVGFPQLATAEKGQRFLNVAVERTVEVIETLRKRPLPD